MVTPSAYGSFRDEAARRTAGRLGRRASRKRVVGLSAGALGLATAVFWTTMLTMPPTTEAALFGFPDRTSCLNAGRSLAPWFEGELHRTARAGASPHGEFDPILATFGEAQSRCAAGRTDEALADFQHLANRIAKLEEHRTWTVD
jgi:hypothetical protein